MKKFRNVLAASLAATMLMSTPIMAGCFGGAREISSIVVTNSSVVTSYTLNQTVSFDDIVITAKYNDASTESVSFDDVKVYLDGEDITDNLNKITESIGTKTVTIEYEGKKAVLTITVSSEGDGTTQTVIVAGYEAPTSYTTHLSQKNAAGKTAYVKEKGEQKNVYEAEFMTGTDMYTVGDDNAFKFLPTLRFLNAADQPETATSFASKTVISLWNGTEYTALESRDGTEANTVEYYSGETVYVTAYTNNNRYDFVDGVATGNQFKLSVLPASNYVWAAGTPVTCEVTVVDGYNVYSAKDLAVIENDPERTYWNDIKEAEGLTEVNPAAVIFQNDISVTAGDIPAAIQYTLNKTVTYYKDTDADTKAEPITGASTFLYDQKDGKNLNVLSRVIGDGQSFKIYGNYFNLDLSNMPLVCSFANEYEDEGDGTAYGSDGSNAQFLQITGNGDYDEGIQSTGSFEMKNLNVKGNANIANHVYVTGDGDTLPVYAGGLIFVKMEGINATLDNILTRTNFITFFPEGNNANVTLKNSKCYDSYQDAAFVWGKNTFTIENCNFERSGGPLIIAQHKDPVDEPNNYPTITADEDTKWQNLVTGQEFWFTSFNATPYVAQIKSFDGLVFNNFGKGVESSDGKLNLILLLMSDGSTPDSTIGNINVQGSFSYNGYTLDRVDTRDENEKQGLDYPDTFAEWTHTALAQAAAISELGMTFATKSTFAIPTGITENPLAWYSVNGQAADLATVAADFASSNYVSINYGGFGLFLELFSKAQ